jgi:hypothetical protein
MNSPQQGLVGNSNYLFKFRALTSRNLAALVSRTLYFAAPDCFNDPFDCDLDTLLSDGGKTALQDLLQQCQRHVAEKRARNWALLQRHREYRNDPDGIRVKYPLVPMNAKKPDEGNGEVELFQLVEEFQAQRDASDLDPVSNEYRRTVADFYATLLKLIRAQFGIVSLGGDISNILMWSHYADEHRGFALCFDVSKRMFVKQPGVVHYNVEYSPERQVDIAAEGWPGSFVKLFTRKAPDWAYERESRFICDRGPGAREFKSGALHGVVLGCRFGENLKSKETRLLVSQLISFLLSQNKKRPKGSKLHAYIASKRSGRFELSITRVSDLRDLRALFPVSRCSP